jgi:hypothetical protein
MAFSFVMIKYSIKVHVMKQSTIKPDQTVDDQAMRNILAGIYGYPAVLVAHDLGLFRLLGKEALGFDEICVSLNIAHALHRH